MHAATNNAATDNRHAKPHTPLNLPIVPPHRNQVMREFSTLMPDSLAKLEKFENSGFLIR
jgi:hypothetical protein